MPRSPPASVAASKTIESHRTSLYRKLGVHNASELIVTALRHRLIAL